MLLHEPRFDYRKGTIRQYWCEGVITREWETEPGRFMRIDAQLFAMDSLLPDTIRRGDRFTLLGIPFVALRQDFVSQSWRCMRTDMPLSWIARALDAAHHRLMMMEGELFRLLYRAHCLDHTDPGAHPEWRDVRGFGWLRTRLNARRDRKRFVPARTATVR